MKLRADLRTINGDSKKVQWIAESGIQTEAMSFNFLFFCFQKPSRSSSLWQKRKVPWKILVISPYSLSWMINNPLRWLLQRLLHGSSKRRKLQTRTESSRGIELPVAPRMVRYIFPSAISDRAHLRVSDFNSASEVGIERRIDSNQIRERSDSGE